MWFNRRKDELIANLKDCLAIQEKLIAHLRENYQRDLDSAILAYGEDMYPQLVKEREHWQQTAERLQRELNRLSDSE